MLSTTETSRVDQLPVGGDGRWRDPPWQSVSKLSIVIIPDTQKSVKSKLLFSVQFEKQYKDKSIYAIIKPALTTHDLAVSRFRRMTLSREALSIMDNYGCRKSFYQMVKKNTTTFFDMILDGSVQFMLYLNQFNA